MNLRRGFFFGIIILLFPLLNFSKELNLSLKDALELALTNNPDLRLERFNLEIAQLQVIQLKGNYDPYVQLNSSYYSSQRPTSQPAFGKKTETLQLNFSTGITTPIGGNITMDFRNSRQESDSMFMKLNPSYNTDLGLSFRQPLLKNGLYDWRGNQLAQRENDYKKAELSLKSRTLEIAGKVEDAYWSLVRARLEFEVAKQTAQRAENVLRLTQAQVKAGLLAPVNEIQSKASLESARASLIRSSAEVKRAENQLKQLLYFATEEELLETEIVPTDLPESEREEFEPKEVQEKVLRNNFYMAQLKLNLENVRLANVRTKSQLFPQLDLSGSMTISGLAGKTNRQPQLVQTGFVIPNPLPTPEPYMLEWTTIIPPESEYEGDYFDALNNLFEERNLSWQAGLIFQVPIGSRTARSEWKIAQYNYERAELELAKQKRELIFLVDSLLEDIDLSYQAYLAAKTARELAEKSREIEQKKYELGLSTQYQLMEEEERYSDAKKNEISALIEYNKAKGRLHRAEQGYLTGGISALSGFTGTGLTIPSLGAISAGAGGGVDLSKYASMLPAGFDLNMLKAFGISLP